MRRFEWKEARRGGSDVTCLTDDTTLNIEDVRTITS